MTRRLLRLNTLLAVLAGFTPARYALAGSAGPSSDFATAAAAAFTEADANGDGKLTSDEFANYGTLLRQKLDALRFARLDTNGDGALTQDELNAGHPGGCGGFPPPF